MMATAVRKLNPIAFLGEAKVNLFASSSSPCRMPDEPFVFRTNYGMAILFDRYSSFARAHAI